MKISKKGIELIKKYEGCKLNAYLCPANVWTIGFGHTSGVQKGDKCTMVQAEKWLVSDLKKFEKYVENYVTVELNQNMFDALVSFTYNLGGGNLKKSTLLKLLNKGDYFGASNEFSKWCYAGGKKLNGLVKRRNEEKELFLKGFETFENNEFIMPSLKGYKGFSLVDGLKQFGYDSSFEYRKRVASLVGISKYKGSSKQNTYLLNYLKTI